MTEEFQLLEKVFQNWKKEAEMFFVTKFIESPTIKNHFSNCLDIIFKVTGTIDSNRGIIAYNRSYGQGKSFFFEVMNHRFRRRKGKSYFVVTSAKDLVQIFKDGGEVELLKFIKCKRLFIDDIGDEGKIKFFKHYANEMNVLRYVLLKRYEFWLSKGWLTYGTTNLSEEQMAKEYDGRVADRLQQMCHWMSFEFLSNGKSFRQYEGTRRLTPEEIKSSWNLFKKEPVKEKIDFIGYLNSMMQEEEGYLMSPDWTRWQMIKPYLEERDLIDINSIGEEEMKRAEVIVQTEAADTTKRRLKSMSESLQSYRANKARKSVSGLEVIKVAECLLIREKFLELKSNNYVFEPIK